MLRNISAEALPKSDRFAMLSELSAELQREQFHGGEEIRDRERDILGRWNAFLALLSRRETELARLKELSTLLAELDELGDELAQLGKELRQKEQVKVRGIWDLGFEGFGREGLNQQEE
jgi:spectrin beta